MAINAYSSDQNTKLIFHDAVRPLVNDRIINDTIIALNNYNAVDVVVPAIDTIVQVDESMQVITNIPYRKYLKRGQTPQGFRLSTIQQAYSIALKDPNFISSDDCGTVVKYLPNEKVFVIKGEESNMKLTYKEDTFLLDKLFQLRSYSIYENISFDLLNNKIIVVFGGNSGIGKSLCDISESYGANVFAFSRSTTNTDISNKQSITKALDDVYNKTGRIDFVINTAAILRKEPLLIMENECINEMIQTNYLGMVNIAIESYKFLKESKGQLLLYTSSSYTRGRAFYSIYSSTKAAAVNFVQAISQEWEVDNIKVNIINPERTLTPMRISNFGAEPVNTLLSSDEVAKVSLLTLLSNFTGQVIDVKIKSNK